MSARAWALLVATVLAAGCSAAREPGTGTPAAAPRIPSDYVAVKPVGGLAEAGLAGVRPFPDETATLRGPSFSYTVVASVATRRLPPELASLLGMPAGAAPAPGHELVLAELAPSRAYLPPDPTRTAPQAVEVVAASATRRLPAEGLLTGTIAVSVPAGVRPVLRVTDAGRRQSLDLGTGRRGGDAVAGYYPVRHLDWQPSELETTGLQLSGPGAAAIPANARVAGIQLDDVEGSLLPYVPGRGWARDGRAWLVLRPEIDYTRITAGTTGRDRVTVDVRSFTVSGPDGTRYPVSGRPIAVGKSTSPSDFPLGQGGTGTLVLDVPATLPRATVAFSFTGTIRLPAGPVDWSIYANPVQSGPLVPS